jgi:hypothetical protein
VPVEAAAAAVNDVLDDQRPGCVLDIGNQDGGALAGQPLGDGFTNSAGCTRHERDPALQPFHRGPLSSVPRNALIVWIRTHGSRHSGTESYEPHPLLRSTQAESLT